MKTPNQLRALARRIEPLAAWYHLHKPDCPAITLLASEITLLRHNPEAAKRLGFIIGDDRICFDGFEVRSLAEGGEKK